MITVASSPWPHILCQKTVRECPELFLAIVNERMAAPGRLESKFKLVYILWARVACMQSLHTL